MSAASDINLNSGSRCMRRCVRAGKYATIALCILLLGSCRKKNDTRTILLLANQEHFGLFTAELLKTEGFNHYVKDSIN
jgi:hypothetical protein